MFLEGSSYNQYFGTCTLYVSIAMGDLHGPTCSLYTCNQRSVFQGANAGEEGRLVSGKAIDNYTQLKINIIKL